MAVLFCLGVCFCLLFLLIREQIMARDIETLYLKCTNLQRTLNIINIDQGEMLHRAGVLKDVALRLERIEKGLALTMQSLPVLLKAKEFNCPTYNV